MEKTERVTFIIYPCSSVFICGCNALALCGAARLIRWTLS